MKVLVSGHNGYIGSIMVPMLKSHGHEVKGVSQNIIDISDGVIEIPQFGTKHSLNISVSAGIVIWDLFKKLSIV